MRRVVLAAILGAFTFVGCTSEHISTVVAPSVETINADQLKQLIDSGQEFVLLDVRGADEIAKNGTLPGYLHIPLGELNARMGEVPKGKLIIAACEMGGRAGRAAAALQKAGYDNVRSFGFAEYRAKGYPLAHPVAAH
jgi:rhodanese-related sulfurtransferase